MSRQPVYINNYISIKSTLFQEQNGEQAYDVDDCPITFDTHNVRVCPTNVTIMCSHPVWVFRLIGLYSGAVSFKVICSRRPYRDAYQWDLSLNMRPVLTAKQVDDRQQISLHNLNLPSAKTHQSLCVQRKAEVGEGGLTWCARRSTGCRSTRHPTAGCRHWAERSPRECTAVAAAAAVSTRWRPPRSEQTQQIVNSKHCIVN